MGLFGNGANRDARKVMENWAKHNLIKPEKPTKEQKEAGKYAAKADKYAKRSKR